MTRFGHKLNYVINTFVKHTPGLLNGLEYLRRTGDLSGDNITRDYCEIY